VGWDASNVALAPGRAGRAVRGPQLVVLDGVVKDSFGDGRRRDCRNEADSEAIFRSAVVQVVVGRGNLEMERANTWR